MDQVVNSLLMVAAHVGSRGLLAKSWREIVSFSNADFLYYLLYAIASIAAPIYGHPLIYALLVRTHLALPSMRTLFDEPILQLWNIVVTDETLKNVIASVTKNWQVGNRISIFSITASA